MRPSLAILLLLPVALAAAEPVPRGGVGPDTLPLAVLSGRDLPAIGQAIEGIRRIPGLKVEVFELWRGVAETDRAALALAKPRYAAAVALGGSALDFLREGRYRLRAAATLVIGPIPRTDVEVVPYEPGPEALAELWARILPAGSRVGVIASGKPEVERLEPLATALEARGLALAIERVSSKRSLSETCRAALTGTAALYFPRDRGLLDAETVRNVFKEAHRRSVPVFAFSRALVRSGALLALDLAPEEAGELAARRALGIGAGGSGTTLTWSRERAEYLRIELPDDLSSQARDP